MAAGLAVALAQVLQLPHPIYALLAAVIVTDLSPSKTRQLGLQRLAGSVLGAAIGGVLSLVLPPGGLAVTISILFAMLITYLAGMPDAAKVAGYICGIVVLAHGAQPWPYAVYRTVETLLGIGTALLVSMVPKLLRVEEPVERGRDQKS